MRSLFSLNFLKNSDKGPVQRQRISKDEQRVSVQGSLGTVARIIERDWEAEFLKAEEMFKDFAVDNPVISTLSQGAHAHMNAARTAHGFSMFSQAADHLDALKGLWESIGINLYLTELKQAGFLLSEVFKSEVKDFIFVDNSRAWSVFNNESSRLQYLGLLAMCAGIAKDFPQLSICFKLARKIRRSENDLFVWVICIEDKMYWYDIRYLGEYLRDYNIGVHLEQEEGSFAVVVTSGSRRQREEEPQYQYRLSPDRIKPCSLAADQTKKRFVMPNIIGDTLREKGEQSSVWCKIALLASALGLKEFVEMCAEEIMRENIKETLHAQEISGSFLSSSQQKEITASPLIPALRNIHVTLDSQFFTWLESLRSVSISLPEDVSVKSLEESLLFYAEIERSKRGQDHSISFFWRIGPWLFQFMEVSLNNKKELVGALPHSVRRRKR